MPLALALMYLTTVLVVILIGIFVFHQNKTNPSNRAFFTLTIAQVVWILSLFFGYQFVYTRPMNLVRSEFFVQLAYGAGPIMMLALIIFLYYFPRITIRFSKVLSWLYIGLMLVMALIASFTELVHDEQIIENGKYITDSFGPLYDFYSILLLTSLLLATYIATKKSFALKGLERRKILYATVGCWLYGFSTIITNLILPLYDLNLLGNIILVEISPVYIMFFAIPTFYSIYKHRFFNFSYVSFHAFRELILSVIFLLSTFALYVLLLNLAPNLGILALIGISSLAAFMLNGKIREYIPEFVAEGLRALRRTISELRSTILTCESLEQLQSAVEKAFVVDLNFVNAKLYVLLKNGDNLGLPAYQKNILTKTLMDHKKDVLIRAEIEYSKIDDAHKKKLLSSMAKLEADVFIPLLSEGNLIGFFAMKKGGSDPIYAKEEISEILAAKRRLEIALMNILLKMNLEEENNLMRSIINRKTRQLKTKIKQINELLKQQADFIAVTAHEFRTPLTIATFQVDSLMHSKRPAIQKIKDLKVVEMSINNLKTLTEKLFAVQQYDLNKVSLNLEKIDLTSFVDGLFRDFIPIMKKKGLKFELKKGVKKKVFANVDQTQFRQVLSNLMNNASKFTPKKGMIRLEMRLNKGDIEINIDDNGDGIPDDLKKTIFEKFRTKHAGAGIGLGLYLCKKIIALHKGKLWVEDSKLGGASFRINLKAVR